MPVRSSFLCFLLPLNATAAPSEKLTLLYLANDVIQNSKKKGPEYRVEFVRVLPQAFQLVSREKDSSLQRSVERIVNIWEERKVFDGETVGKLRSLLGKKNWSDVIMSQTPWVWSFLFVAVLFGLTLCLLT